MKNYIRRLKKELVFYIILGLALGAALAFIYLEYNPILYTTIAKIGFSDIGRDLFEKTGFAAEPDRIFLNEKLKFVSQKQKNSVKFEVSQDRRYLSINVKSHDPSGALKLVNTITESYLSEINNNGSGLMENITREELKKIDKQIVQYKSESDRVNEKLNELEPKLEVLQRQQEAADTLRESLKTRIANLEIRKSELLRIFTEAHPEVIGINSELTALKSKLTELPVIEGIRPLKQEVSGNKAKYSELQEKLPHLNKQKDAFLGAHIEPLAVIKEYAAKPTVPIGDVDELDIYKRFIFSCMLVMFIASLVATGFKDTIVSEFEIANIQGLPLIATVPFVKPDKIRKEKNQKGKKSGIGRHLLFFYDDSSEYVNAYRSLAMHLKMDAFGADIDKKVLIFSNPTGRTGKSTVCANLAISLVRSGKKTVLLDANLNKTSVAKFFGIRAKVLGISDILSGRATLQDCLKNVTDMLLGGVDWDIAMKAYGLDRLKILPSGTRVSDPAGLLESEKLSGLFKQLRDEFDCIIVDSPALLKGPDSILISSGADGIFLVCKTHYTSYKDLMKCNKKLERLNIQAKGSILVCI
ncbi:MAG: AAA family ATPase [Candidatus Omnitrophica bacterium]|nr:AAA family ATPase [Candidatus Omnitrophota bacterium]